MRTHLVLPLAILLMALLASLSTADPVIDAIVASPDRFKVLLENDNVRVLEYELLPGQRDQWHTHPPKVSYVVAGGTLRITTEDGSSFEVTETTGAATWMSELGRHFAENVGPTPVRILLVEVKALHQATLLESDQKTKEISTDELRSILEAKSATVFDARPFKEYAISHIPGAINVSARPGVPMSLYVSDVAEIGRALNGTKEAPIVLYCNGPFCGKSKRLAAELLDAGYMNVRRYQLGIPVWRAFGGLTQIEPEGLRHVVENDRTAVFIDAREATEFKAGSTAQARNIPRSGLKPGKDTGEIKAAKDDGRLPMEDHNTRVVVFGESGEQAKAVAEAIVREAFHNVSFFDGGFEQFKSAVHP